MVALIALGSFIIHLFATLPEHKAEDIGFAQVFMVQASVLILGFTAQVWIGLMPSEFDFDKHRAVCLPSLYNGWTFYNLRYALCNPFYHSTMLYAEVDFLGHEALRACDNYL